MHRSGVARGLVGGAIVVIGLIMLLARIIDFDAGMWWPVFVIMPGLFALIAGLAAVPSGGGNAAVIVGSQLTALGFLFLFQNSTGLWRTWAYAWTLIWPGSIGLGVALRGALTGEPTAVRRGRRATMVGAGLFVLGFVFFEGIIGISGSQLGFLGDLALPALLIGFGLLLILRRR